MEASQLNSNYSEFKTILNLKTKFNKLTINNQEQYTN